MQKSGYFLRESLEPVQENQQNKYCADNNTFTERVCGKLREEEEIK